VLRNIQKKTPIILNLSITLLAGSIFPLFLRFPPQLFRAYHFINKTREKGTFFEIEPFNASNYATHTLALPRVSFPSSSQMLFCKLQSIAQRAMGTVTL
jgi:hypothetical protein